MTKTIAPNAVYLHRSKSLILKASASLTFSVQLTIRFVHSYYLQHQTNHVFSYVFSYEIRNNAKLMNWITCLLRLNGNSANDETSIANFGNTNKIYRIGFAKPIVLAFRFLSSRTLLGVPLSFFSINLQDSSLLLPKIRPYFGLTIIARIYNCFHFYQPPFL